MTTNDTNNKHYYSRVENNAMYHYGWAVLLVKKKLADEWIQLKKGGGYWLYVKLSVQEYSEGEVSSVVHYHYFLLV